MLTCVTVFILLHSTFCHRIYLQVGQRIIEVNGQSLLGATHQEAVNILRNAGDEIRLLVCDGFNPSALPEGEGVRLYISTHRYISVLIKRARESLTFCYVLRFKEIIFAVVKNEMFKTLKCIFVVLS